jgi:type VI secretion system secreted protein VgrG
MPLSENELEFDFELGPYSASDLSVVEWHAQEAMSRPFELAVELLAAEGVEVDPKKVIGKDAMLTIHLDGGDTRYIRGVVAQVRAWSREDGKGQGYHAQVVPALARLGLVTRSRIFQQQSVTEIVKKVLDDAKVKNKLSLQGSYGKRDYCVQYRESDLAFVSRLCEEEGIFYFFEHDSDHHVVVFGDNPGAHAPIPGSTDKLPFSPTAGMIANVECVTGISLATSVRPGAVALRDFSFKNPTLDLGATSTAKDGDAALEIYDYPGEYTTPGLGKALAKVRLEEQQTDVNVAFGSTSCRRLAPGFRFALDEHPTESFNQKYLVREVTHVGRQPEVLLGANPAAGPDEKSPYEASFVAQPGDIPFRPARTTPRPFVQGPQTAVVVGPSGEEIHTDEFGRVKVHFHWDREGKNDEKASCWVRVSQLWAGGGFGTLFLPRIGQEVVVHFLEGDPDRPIIIGRVYNGQNPTPYGLPGSKTQSGVRSNSSTGGGGFNEIMFEDAAGGELVYHQAQKDLKIEVKNDKRQHVGGNEGLKVDGNRERSVSGNQSLDVGGNDGTSVGGSQTVTIGGNRSTSVSGSRSETIAVSHTERVGAAYTLTVGAAAAVSVGGALAETVGAVKSETVAGAKMQQIGAAKVVTVAGASSEAVGGNRSFDISGELSIGVKKAMKVTVKGEHRIDVAEKMTTEVEKEIEVTGQKIKLEGKDELVLKVGDSTVTIKSDGIVVKSSKVTVDASGDLVLKGSSIKAN